MGVAERRIGHEQLLLLQRPLGELLRPEFQQQLARAIRRGLFAFVRWNSCRNKVFLRHKIFRLWIAVYRHVADEVQQFGRAVALDLELE